MSIGYFIRQVRCPSADWSGTESHDTVLISNSVSSKLPSYIYRQLTTMIGPISICVHDPTVVVQLPKAKPFGIRLVSHV